MPQTVEVLFRLRCDTKENFETENPPLSDGEPVLVKDGNKFYMKFGNGNYYNNLDFVTHPDTMYILHDQIIQGKKEFKHIKVPTIKPTGSENGTIWMSAGNFSD